jgi:hypothetical protein
MNTVNPVQFYPRNPGLNLSICTFCTENPGSRDPGYLKEGLSPLPWIYKFFTNSTSGQFFVVEICSIKYIHEPKSSATEIPKYLKS